MKIESETGHRRRSYPIPFLLNFLYELKYFISDFYKKFL